jgi:uncharacterized protein (TIGR00106 family)
MIAELTILPIGSEPHLTHAIAEAVRVVADSGLEYQVTAMGTLLQGDEEAVWETIRRCHRAARQVTRGRIVTEVRIDDGSDVQSTLSHGVRRVQEDLGRHLQTAPRDPDVS